MATLTMNDLRNVIKHEVKRSLREGSPADAGDPDAWLDSDVVDSDQLMWFMDHVEFDLNGCERAVDVPGSPFDPKKSHHNQEVFTSGHRRVYVSDVTFHTMPRVEIDDGSGWRSVRVVGFD
jgi:hypothetical protein